MFTYGAAVMYNYTNASPEWIIRLSGLLESAGPQFFGPFPNATNVMYESACELGNTCNNDQYSFKAYLARWMGKAAVLAPYVADFVNDLLGVSALAATASCANSAGAVTCGTQWYTGSYDGQTGLGQQLSALECVQALLANRTTPPTYNISVTGAQNARQSSMLFPIYDSAIEIGPSASTIALSTIDHSVVLGTLLLEACIKYRAIFITSAGDAPSISPMLNPCLGRNPFPANLSPYYNHRILNKQSTNIEYRHFGRPQRDH